MLDFPLQLESRSSQYSRGTVAESSLESHGSGRLRFAQDINSRTERPLLRRSSDLLDGLLRSAEASGNVGPRSKSAGIIHGLWRYDRSMGELRNRESEDTQSFWFHWFHAARAYSHWEAPLRFYTFLQAIVSYKAPLQRFSKRKMAQMFRDVAAILRLPSETFTLGSIRAGGAACIFQEGGDVDRIRFLGRWRSHNTLRHYIQVGMAAMMAAKLTPGAAEMISFAARHFDLM